jgi:hypothetical protein
MPTAAATALTDSAYAPIFASAADQLPTPAQAAPGTNADDADDAADTTAALAAVHAALTAELADVHAQLALLRVQDAACKAKHVQHAASMAIKRAQLLGLRSVNKVMTLRGTPARATFRPARFPRQDPLPGQTAAMRQSKAKAMRQAKTRAVQQSKQAKPTRKYAT